MVVTWDGNPPLHLLYSQKCWTSPPSSPLAALLSVITPFIISATSLLPEQFLKCGVEFSEVGHSETNRNQWLTIIKVTILIKKNDHKSSRNICLEYGYSCFAMGFWKMWEIKTLSTDLDTFRMTDSQGLTWLEYLMLAWWLFRVVYNLIFPLNKYGYNQYFNDNKISNDNWKTIRKG